MNWPASRRTDDTTRGSIEMAASMTISGTIGWFVVRSGRPILEVVFWRCVFGAGTLLAACAALGLLRGPVTRRQLGLATLGGLAIVANWLLLFAAYPRASISIATVVYNTQPFMLVGLGALLFSERLTVARLGWLAVAFGGVLLIVQAESGAGPAGIDPPAGIALALGAAFFYAVAAAITKRLTGMAPHLIALIQVCVGALALAPLVDFSGHPSDGSSWATLVTVGVVHTGLVYILLYGAIQKLPTHLTGSLSFIYPVVAVAVDELAFGHRLRPVQLAGAVAILIAAAGNNLGWSPRRWALRRGD